MTNKQRNYEYGYKQAMAGKEYRPELSKYAGYDDGWDHGNCDRPTLEEVEPLDIGKERGRWYL